MEKICKGGPLQNFQPTLEDELKLYFFRILNPDICGYTLGMFIFRTRQESLWTQHRLSVSLSVTKNSHTSHHYFFLKIHMKLDHHKCRKVTKPDFPGKLSIFFYKQFFKKSVFGHFLENAALVLAEISYLDSSQHYLQLFYWHYGWEKSSSPIFQPF